MRGLSLMDSNLYPDHYYLICEALVRQSRDADRWSAVIEAWEALSNVKRMALELGEEAKHIREADASIT